MNLLSIYIPHSDELLSVAHQARITRANFYEVKNGDDMLEIGHINLIRQGKKDNE